MKKFFKSRKFAVLIATVIILSVLIGYAGSIENPVTAPQRVFVSVMTPALRIAEAAGGDALRYIDNLFRVEELAKENTELKVEISALQKQLANYETVISEQDAKDDLKALQLQNPEDDYLPATVVGRDPLAGFELFTINVGTESDVSVGDAVVSESGLCGVVIEAGTGYSVVRTILSPSLNVSALLSSSRETGIVTGDESRVEQVTTMKLLSKDTQLQLSELVVTSGEGGILPQGIIIGTVESIELSPSGKSMTAIVNTAEDVSRVSSVFVVLSNEVQSGE